MSKISLDVDFTLGLVEDLSRYRPLRDDEVDVLVRLVTITSPNNCHHKWTKEEDSFIMQPTKEVGEIAERAKQIGVTAEKAWERRRMLKERYAKTQVEDRRATA